MSSKSPGALSRLTLLVRYASEAAAFFAIIGFFRVFPVDTASAIGGWFGRTLLYRTHLSNRARDNLTAAYPELDTNQREQIVREMWDNLGRNIAEYAHLGEMSIRGNRPRIELAGLQNYENAAARGKGIIFISAHFANWEIMPFGALQHGVEEV